MERIASRNPLIAYEKLEQRLAKRTRLYWLKRFSAAAACIIAIIGLSTLFSHRKVDSEFGDPQIITLQANAGVRTRFNLPDGTVVYLNSGSVLSYPMSYDQKKEKYVYQEKPILKSLTTKNNLLLSVLQEISIGLEF